jgi:DNA replication protein DnaC
MMGVDQGSEASAGAVLVVTAEGLRSAVLNKTRFDEDQTLWDRALSVEFLVLDDLGKEHRDAQGFGERLFEDLIRQRSGAMKVTFMTSNMSPAQMQGGEHAYKPSMLRVMREVVTPIRLDAPESWNRRLQASEQNRLLMTGS